MCQGHTMKALGFKAKYVWMPVLQVPPPPPLNGKSYIASKWLHIWRRKTPMVQIWNLLCDLVTLLQKKKKKGSIFVSRTVKQIFLMAFLWRVGKNLWWVTIINTLKLFKKPLPNECACVPVNCFQYSVAA